MSIVRDCCSTGIEMADFDWANASVAKVLDLYIAWFNRVPDVDGMSGWITKLQSGESIESVSAQFLAAAYQYTDQTGYTAAMTDHQFIVKLYEGVLGRSGNLAPDESETTYWKSALADVGGNRGELVLRMLAEAKAFDAEGRPEIQAIIDTLNNKTAVSKYALDQGITYGSAELSIIQGKAFLDGIDGTPDSALDAKTEVDMHLTADPLVFNVEQVHQGSHLAQPYKLLDTVKNIAAWPQYAEEAVSYSVTNWQGSVGALTVQQAEVLRSAANYSNYDYSLADSVANLKALPDNVERKALILDADTVAAVGTGADDMISFTSFGRNVIINGHGGNDNMTGSRFNDTFYGGDGNNIYCGNGGADTFILTGGDSDTVYLTKIAMGGVFDGNNRVYVKDFDPDDLIKISQQDVSANLQGSFTHDDYHTLAAHDWNSTVAAEKLLTAMHGVAVVEFEGGVNSSTTPLGSALDGRQLIKSVSDYVGNTVDYISVVSGWDGFFVRQQDDRTTYIYYASDDGDGKMSAAEIDLVGTFDTWRAEFSNGLSSFYFTL